MEQKDPPAYASWVHSLLCPAVSCPSNLKRNVPGLSSEISWTQGSYWECPSSGFTLVPTLVQGFPGQIWSPVWSHPMVEGIKSPTCDGYLVMIAVDLASPSTGRLKFSQWALGGDSRAYAPCSENCFPEQTAFHLCPYWLWAPSLGPVLSYWLLPLSENVCAWELWIHPSWYL